MIELFDKDQLDRLVESRAPREHFGPGTERPCLVFDLDGTDNSQSQWLLDLPCPTIGIGAGGLSGACDILLEDREPLYPIVGNIANAPIAAMILVQHLRASELLDLQNALTAESFAYATAQKGPEFLSWLSSQKSTGQAPSLSSKPLIVDSDGARLNLVLNDPDNLNAIGVDMRDALCEALDLALADQSYAEICLTAAGRAFSTGGEVREFGDISDPATAHWVRSLRLPAWRLARLQDRLTVHVNGAAIGAGAEIAAFGTHVSASPAAWFQLPELQYGLIPGAGGTASLPRRIGRQRTAYLALSMKKINAQTALDWGLVDELVS